MLHQTNQKNMILVVTAFTFLFSFAFSQTKAKDLLNVAPGNFGLPGIIDLPSARKFSDGEILITHQNHEYLLMNGISFQALPRLGLAFRYGGQGRGGGYAQGRVNWDRSFDAHISILDEGKYLPAVSIGLRDLIGTGWYSSEYIVGSKKIGNLELSAGLGFGRLSGRNSFSNPLLNLSSEFAIRLPSRRRGDKGGTLGNINWFHGDTSAFYGANYRLDEKVMFSLEYNPDNMTRESVYLSVDSPWSLGATYQLNDYVNISAQYLYGSQLSLTAHVAINPAQPPLVGGKELAPVPMRMRGRGALPVLESDENFIKKVLEADRFEIHYLKIEPGLINIAVTNTKFRSTAQAVGRIASTLQRFTSDKIKVAEITFYSGDLRVAKYRVDLEKITKEQLDPIDPKIDQTAITAINPKNKNTKFNNERFTWGLGPYIAHRLFNPDLPLSVETGVEVVAGLQIFQGLNLSGSLRKSLFTNLTDNNRFSNSVLPRVHSDWPLYDFGGQSGHIHQLTLSYIKNLAPGLYGRAHAGLLEPFFAGFGAEILYKPAKWPLGVGIDVHQVQKRDYSMRFDLLDYETTVGHFSLYYDAGGKFDLEVNAGKYLAGDWGFTTTVSRKFGSGWEVGGYATLTDVPFNTFGEGSFDKAIYVSIPIDWIISSPNRTRRRLTLRPITRDGGANLSSARKLNKHIANFQNAEFQREIGRLWR